MRGRTLAVMAGQAALVAVLAVALAQAVETAPAHRMASATPTPCEVRRINLADPELKDHTIECAAADATATAYIMVAVTVTPCDPWGDENKTPIPGPLPMRLASPCSSVASDATWTAHHATRTAGIIDGSYYGLHISNSAPRWTPTIYAYGTVPPEVLAGYPATLTALPQETPHGWRLDGDRWVMDDRRQP